jgi:hypothetical protein
MPAAIDIATIIPYLDDLVSATQTGTMKWSSANPSTYYWTTMSPRPARLTIQRVPKGTPKVNPSNRTMYVTQAHEHILQAFDQTNNLQFALDGTESELVNKKLGQIFDAIEASIARQGLDFFKSVIPQKK